jgi:hypothetical protein
LAGGGGAFEFLPLFDSTTSFNDACTGTTGTLANSSMAAFIMGESMSLAFGADWMSNAVPIHMQNSVLMA